MITLLSNIQQEPFGNILDKIIMLKRTLFLVISLLWAVNAFALTISPDKAVVAIGQQLTLSAANGKGSLIWSAMRGTIVNDNGKESTYIAPQKPGKDIVTVIDDMGTAASTSIIIQPPTNIENITRQLFTYHGSVTSLLLSKDKKFLYVGTLGGLERRESQTGELLRLFTEVDGLPDNRILNLANGYAKNEIWVLTYNGLTLCIDNMGRMLCERKELLKPIYTLLEDDNGGIWLGSTAELIHFIPTNGIAEQWKVFSFNSESWAEFLPSKSIRYLSRDTNGRILIGVYESRTLILFIESGGKGDFYTEILPKSSGTITSFFSDPNGKIWVGTTNGLLCREKRKWTSFHTNNSGLPSNIVKSLLGDEVGGVWVGTTGGLSYLTKDGNWIAFDKYNYMFINEGISSLSSDGQGGIFAGGWSLSGDGGILRYTRDGNFTLVSTDTFPNIFIIGGLAFDETGKIWMKGTGSDPLYYFDNGVWMTFDLKNFNFNSEYTNEVTNIFGDNYSGGIWIGTRSGLLHGVMRGKWEWEIFDETNSNLPNSNLSGISYNIKNIFSDKQGGVWIEALQSERTVLINFSSDRKWSEPIDITESIIGNTYNLSSITADKDGNIWFGTSNHGLICRTKYGNLLRLNETNSSLPSNNISSLYSDDNGLWIGTDTKILYRSIADEWIVLDLNTRVTGIVGDDTGGVWIGTIGGLFYRDKIGNLTKIFSSYSVKNIYYYNGKVWLNLGYPDSPLLSGGVMSLSLSVKVGICDKVDLETCAKIQLSKRATILISGGGSQDSNTIWHVTHAINTHIYKILHSSGFDHNEIYYLSPVEWADFTGEGANDRIVDAPNVEFIDNNNDKINDRVDRPLESDDVRNALNWAKQRGKLDQPLYIFFIDHGGEDKFQLSKDNLLDVEEFGIMLNDYQTETGNEVVLVIDACFSGKLGEKLKADKRAIIASTYNGLAYFNTLSNQGFSRFFIDWLSKGMSFNEAFTYATEEQKKLLGNLDLRAGLTGGTQSTAQEIQQVPQKYDQNQTYSLDKLFLNGGFVTGDATLAVKSLTPSTTLKANTPFQFKAQATVAQGKVQQVWAVVRPPRIDLLLDSYNTPILAYPREILTPTTDNEWQGIWTDTRYNGEYKITFYAKDKEGDVVSSDETVTLTVTDGIDPPKTANTQIQLNQLSYKIGDILKAAVTEELQWGYDLYLAVILPSGDFITVKEKNNFSSPNKAEVWRGKRQQGIANPFLELSLPTLPRGQYCLLSVLSPQDESVMNMTKFWKQSQQCIEIN